MYIAAWSIEADKALSKDIGNNTAIRRRLGSVHRESQRESSLSGAAAERLRRPAP